MDKQIRNMMEWCPYLTLNQQISIDGIGKDHNAIRMDKQVVGGDNSFEKAIKTIEHLKELKKVYQRINIGIIITFTNENQKKFKDILKEIYSITNPDNISINLVRGDPKQKVNLDLDLNLYREAVKYRDSLFYEKKMSGHAKFKGNRLATAGRILLNGDLLYGKTSSNRVGGSMLLMNKSASYFVPVELIAYFTILSLTSSLAISVSSTTSI